VPANLAIAAVALAIEAAFGYPRAIERAIGHPVIWIGALIGRLDRRLNRGRRAQGALALTLVLLAAGLPAFAIQAALLRVLPSWAAIALLALAASSLLAGRSLAVHVRAVADGLTASGVAGGRAAVARIVGRDPASLDAAGVARAAIESLAENFSDAVVAPAFWCALLGLPGIVLYKAVNTADSMIGHRTPRHEAFGWAAARLDDWLNLPASRLSALLLAGAALLHRADAHAAWCAPLRDAPHHRSPNAGWPEAAMAAALGLRLAGPRVYGGVRVDDAWMGDGTPAATAADIGRALSLYRTACALLILLALAAAFMVA
jgi:adenosylcobinamide-phosphate synthase